jgi:hypothetical protein
VRVFPKNREPYTYNTSTYLSMILSDTGERAGGITKFIDSELAAFSPVNFSDFDAFTFVLPGAWSELRPMLRTKFDELFGSKVSGRIFTSEEFKHAKTVVPNERELFISIGLPAADIGREAKWIEVPLPPNSGYGAAIATSYYLVGLIQQTQPAYCAAASKTFGHEIKPIVE